jgi:hypothetical protein
MRADIHNGQEHERSIHGPDTEARNKVPLELKYGDRVRERTYVPSIWSSA